MSKKVENNVFYINEKKVDYDKIGRWSLGDMEDLEEKNVDIEKLVDGSLSFREAIDLVHHFGNKVNGEIERKDVRELFPQDLGDHAKAILEAINEGQDKADPSS